MQEFLWQLSQFLTGAAVYYVVQLGRSAMLSIAILGFIMVLRKTLFQKTVFLKGMLWALLIPVPFVGKLKLFYENRFWVRLLIWWHNICFENPWFCFLYLGIAAGFGIGIFIRRRKLRLYAKGLKKEEIDGTKVLVSNMQITPFVSGLIRPRIVLPEIMAANFHRGEIKTVILHEQIHIRQGHLVWFFFWDALRALLWLNPFLTVWAKHFREDMEDICDKVTIHKCNDDFYDYGKLLLKSLRCLQEEKQFGGAAAFAGNKEYESVKRRIISVSKYKPYRRAAAWCMVFLAALSVAGMMVLVRQNSYKRCNDMNVASIYHVEDEEIFWLATGEELAQALAYDDDYLYVDTSALNNAIPLEEYRDKELFIFFGGFYKIPGLGGGGDCACVNGENLLGGNCKIAYEKAEDTLLIKLLKMI